MRQPLYYNCTFTHDCISPLTKPSTERSLSSQKQLITYLRNQTGENRLNGLANKSINCDVKVDIEDVLRDFERKSRRIKIEEVLKSAYLVFVSSLSISNIRAL